MIDKLMILRGALVLMSMLLYVWIGAWIGVSDGYQVRLLLCLFGMITALVLDTAVTRFVESGGSSDFLAVGGRLKVAMAIAIETPGRQTWQMKAAMI